MGGDAVQLAQERLESSLKSLRSSVSGKSQVDGTGTPRKLTGADLYATYMDTYHRRIRKGQPQYGDDAAGLTTNQRFHARRTPLKGKGCPPPDNNTPDYKPSKRFIPGRSYAAEPELLVHHTTKAAHPLSLSLDSGMLLAAMREAGAGARPASAYGPRLCLKMTPISLRSSLQGSGLAVIQETPEKRPIRKPGDCAPALNTKARVLVLAEDVQQPPATPTAAPAAVAQYLTQLDAYATGYDSPRDRMLNTAWARHTFEAGISSGSRPATAPPQGRSAGAADAADLHLTEARKRYLDVHSMGNFDLFAYRHSAGICPAEYKLDDSRMAAPHLVSPGTESARDVYYEARVGYAKNRVQAILSLPKYG